MPATTWDEICADRSLSNLPYKIETNRAGQIVMSPVTNLHSRQLSEILVNLSRQLESGYLLVGAAVQTTNGVRVADVAWGSDSFQRAHAKDETLTAFPDLCVEVHSLTNFIALMREKLILYFAFGAKEVWLCDEKGKMTFYQSPSSVISASQLFPDFPAQVVGKL